MKVTISDRAAAELRNIGRWIARDDPVRSVSFVRELRSKCDRLAQRPRMYPIANELSAKDVRKCGHGSYLILYRIAGEEVVIVAVVHGAPDWAAMLEDDLSR